MLGTTGGSFLCKRAISSFSSSWIPVPSMLKSKPVISILNLNGVIMNSKNPTNLNVDSVLKNVEAAFKPKKLEAVCLRINSPGGSPVQSQLIYELIRDTAQKKKGEIRLVSFAEDVAASGGYWLLTTGNEIYASRASVVGSIGVIYSQFGFHELIKNYGVERRVLTAGKNKNNLDPFMEQNPEGVAMLKESLESIHRYFIDHVKQSRGTKLKNHHYETLFSGAFWSGEKALELGLVDGIHTFQSWIKQEYKDTDVKLKRFGPKKSLLSSITSQHLSTENTWQKFLINEGGYSNYPEYSSIKL